MRILVDTNVVMDALIGRRPFFERSDQVLKLCGAKKVEGHLAAHTVTNLFYLLRKFYSNDERRDVLLSLFDIFQVERIDETRLRSALLRNDFKDFEDCLQVECAAAVQAEYIVTRNVEDFLTSAVPPIRPDVFCALFDGEGYLG